MKNYDNFYRACRDLGVTPEVTFYNFPALRMLVYNQSYDYCLVAITKLNGGYHLSQTKFFDYISGVIDQEINDIASNLIAKGALIKTDDVDVLAVDIQAYDRAVAFGADFKNAVISRIRNDHLFYYEDYFDEYVTEFEAHTLMCLELDGFLIFHIVRHSSLLRDAIKALTGVKFLKFSFGGTEYVV